MMGHDHSTMDHSNHDARVETTTHNHNNMMSTDSSGGMVHEMVMQMYFEAGYEVIILFQGWDVKTVGAMVGSCFGVFFLAIIYEGLKYFRERLHRKNYVAIDYSKVKAPEGTDGSQVNQVRTAVSCKSSLTSASHYIQTALHLLQLVISYFLMLIVMTYNVWLFISVILGCTVGYFLFGWQKGFLVDITEHCH